MPICTVGFTIDFYILVLPIAAVSTLQLSARKKLGVILLFATGGCKSSLPVTQIIR
jgi:hypothetical protein